jgi:hypothetical protein
MTAFGDSDKMFSPSVKAILGIVNGVEMFFGQQVICSEPPAPKWTIYK